MQNEDGADAALELIMIDAAGQGRGIWKEDTDMEKNYDVIALGELLVDFTMNGQSSRATGCSRHARAERPAMYWRF